MVYIDLATKRLIAIPEDQVKLLKSIEKENA
jgi:hypothetical protein